MPPIPLSLSWAVCDSVGNQLCQDLNLRKEPVSLSSQQDWMKSDTHLGMLNDTEVVAGHPCDGDSFWG